MLLPSFLVMIVECPCCAARHPDCTLRHSRMDLLVTEFKPTSVFSHISFRGFLVLVQAKQAQKVEK